MQLLALEVPNCDRKSKLVVKLVAERRSSYAVCIHRKVSAMLRCTNEYKLRMKLTSKLNESAIGRIAIILTDARLLNLVQLTIPILTLLFLKQVALNEVGKGGGELKAELARIKEKELTTDLGISSN